MRNQPSTMLRLLPLLLLTLPVHADEARPAAGGARPTTISVTGDLPQSGSLDEKALAALAPAPVPFTVHGEAHTGLGVPLHKVLARFGFTPGKMGKDVPPGEKRRGYRMVLVASAPDGFQAVFSTAELSPDMGPTQAYVVYRVDGKALPAESGPFRLVVPTDKEPSRSLRQLQRLEVLDLGKRAAPAR